MARYISDQNKVVLLNESGTYANTSGTGQWPGMVTEHSIEDAENVLTNRFLGNLNRGVNRFDDGPRDVTGTLTYHPQDSKLIFAAIGSVNSVSGATSVHEATEINNDVSQSAFTSGTGQLNAPMSFTLEDSKQAVGTGRNFIRTVKGVVPNTTTIIAAQGEKVSVSIDYIGQTLTASSGATTSLTTVDTRPYLWSDCSINLHSDTGNISGLDTIKSADFEINQNRTGPHYLNGSRDIATPFNGNRDHTVSLTMDLDGDEADMLYNEFYKGGSLFNLVFDMNADNTAGSQHTTLNYSGCRIMTMENPSNIEGTTESTIEIQAGSLSAQAWDSVKNLPAGIYTPW